MLVVTSGLAFLSLSQRLRSRTTVCVRRASLPGCSSMATWYCGRSDGGRNPAGTRESSTIEPMNSTVIAASILPLCSSTLRITRA